MNKERKERMGHITMKLRNKEKKNKERIKDVFIYISFYILKHLQSMENN